MKFKRSGKEIPLTHKDIEITCDLPRITNREIIAEMQTLCLRDGIVKEVEISVNTELDDDCESLTESEFLDAQASDALWLHCSCHARIEIPEYDALDECTVIEHMAEDWSSQPIVLSGAEFQLVRQAASLCYLTSRITRIIANSFYNDTNRN